MTIHKKNLLKLMVEVYKTMNHLSPPYMWDLFTKKVVEYDFRIMILSSTCEITEIWYKFIEMQRQSARE